MRTINWRVQYCLTAARPMTRPPSHVSGVDCPVGGPQGFLGRRIGGQPVAAANLCCCGLMPRTRLKAVLSANGLA
jgi:hypothetical protein